MWKEELVEILFSNDPEKINTKKALNLKYNNIPSSLYKYGLFDKTEYSLEMLETDKMWLSPPTFFNDPYDCALNFAVKDVPNDYILKILDSRRLEQTFKISNDEANELMNSEKFIYDLARFYTEKNDPDHRKPIDEIAEELEKNIKEQYIEVFGIRDKIYITCFSETNKSILMWSHYADNHKGFCVEYNLRELGLNNLTTRYLFPVIYSDDIFNITEYFPSSDKEFEDVMRNYLDGINIHENIEGIKFPERNKTLNNMSIFYAALNKSTEWSYEKEWRYVFPYKNYFMKSIYIDVPKPKAIYLGGKVSEKNRAEVLEIGETRNINIYEMHVKPSKYALESRIIL